LVGSGPVWCGEVRYGLVEQGVSFLMYRFESFKDMKSRTKMREDLEFLGTSINRSLARRFRQTLESERKTLRKGLEEAIRLYLSNKEVNSACKR